MLSALAPGSAEAQCSQTRTYHQHRALALIDHAYEHRAWRKASLVTNSDKRRWQAHKACLGDYGRKRVSRHRSAALRSREAWRDKQREAWEAKQGSCIDEAPAGSEQLLDCIRDGAAHYGQSYSAMVALARCESNLNRLAHNPSGASGLFQFLPSTWAGTPYGSHSIWSARWQGLATGWMLSQGRRGEWVC